MSNRGAECLSGVVTITQGFSDDSLEIRPTKVCTSAEDVASNPLVDMKGPMLGNSHGVSVGATRDRILGLFQSPNEGFMCRGKSANKGSHHHCKFGYVLFTRKDNSCKELGYQIPMTNPPGVAHESGSHGHGLRFDQSQVFRNHALSGSGFRPR